MCIVIVGLPTGLTVYIGVDDPDFHFYGYLGMLMAQEIVKLLTGKCQTIVLSLMHCLFYFKIICMLQCVLSKGIDHLG